MKLAYNDITEVVNLALDRPFVLQVENTALYKNMIQNLFSQIEGEQGKWILNENNKIIAT